MGKLLPFVIIPILIILAGLGYWRYTASKQDLANPQITSLENAASSPMEVPKTLPGATLENRVTSLEDIVVKLVPQVNNLKPQTTQNTTSLDNRLTAIEAAVTEIKARVSALEKSAPASSVSNSKYPLYIPLGASGGPWTDTNWNTLNEYQVSINPDNYSSYTGMILEVNFRLVDPTGTGSIRLYNITDSSVISSEASTSVTSFAVYSTSSFKLPSGTKTYKLQVKSTQGKEIYIQSARIRVNF